MIGGMSQPDRTERIDDPDDPRVRDYLHLTDAAASRRGDVFIVEGRVALERVATSGLTVESLLVTPQRAAQLDAVIDTLADHVPVYVAERDVIARTAGYDVHRGILAVGRRPASLAVEELLAASTRIVATEATSDHENLGSIFRNAAGLGLDGVLLDGRTADPLYRRCVRVSLGWSAVLPHARAASLAETPSAFSAAGFRTVALCPHLGDPVDVAAAAGAFDGRVALLLGAEGPGLDEDTIAAADAVVRIPMAGAADSLNVATAFAVVAAFAAARRGWN
jgi:tRNA G18 (ribose-2'-O)-methylase SpoU